MLWNKHSTNTRLIRERVIWLYRINVHRGQIFHWWQMSNKAISLWINSSKHCQRSIYSTSFDGIIMIAKLSLKHKLLCIDFPDNWSSILSCSYTPFLLCRCTGYIWVMSLISNSSNYFPFGFCWSSLHEHLGWYMAKRVIKMTQR